MTSPKVYQAGKLSCAIYVGSRVGDFLPLVAIFQMLPR
jgi:hypothetical protein